MVQLQGFDELLHALDESTLTFSGRRRLIVRALRKASEPIRDDAAANAPVLSGKLRSDVKTSVVEQTYQGAEAKTGPTDRTFYGKFGEYGTAHQPRRSWLGPAYDRNIEQSVSTVGQIIGDGVAESFYG